MKDAENRMIAAGKAINALIEETRAACAEACAAGNQELAAHLDDTLSGLHAARASGRRAALLVNVSRFGDK